jgi:hypothetical protein
MWTKGLNLKNRVIRPVTSGDGIVPFAVEIGGLDVEGSHLGVSDLDPLRIVTVIEATVSPVSVVVLGIGWTMTR